MVRYEGYSLIVIGATQARERQKMTTTNMATAMEAPERGEESQK
jgi:hypothetical protein